MATTLSTNCNWWYCVRTRRLFHIGNFCFWAPFFKQLLLKHYAVDFVEFCNVCTRKVVIKAAKRIFNSDKICRSYCDFYFGVTFWNTLYVWGQWITQANVDRFYLQYSPVSRQRWRYLFSASDSQWTDGSCASCVALEGPAWLGCVSLAGVCRTNVSSAAALCSHCATNTSTFWCRFSSSAPKLSGSSSRLSTLFRKEAIRLRLCNLQTPCNTWTINLFSERNACTLRMRRCYCCTYEIGKSELYNM